MLKIDIDLSNNFFELIGEISHLTKNKRMMLTLKRLSHSVESDSIKIPYQENNQIEILQELEKLLSKFDIQYSLSEKISTELSSYKRDIENFEVFSNLAKKIRNDEFQDNPELVEY